MALRAITIDPDIAGASTLPGWVYTDPEVFEAGRERVFGRSWQLIADADAVRAPGQVHPVTLLDGLLGEPLLLTRDHEDRVHCLSNVCTHRGTVLVAHPGREKAIVCPYHGRRFDLNGCFRHMPEFDGVRGFPSPADSLPAVPFGSLGERGVLEGRDDAAVVGTGRFYFASLAPAERLAAWLGPMRERLAWYPYDKLVFDSARSREYLVRANWALYCENYLEGFHIPFVHASLHDVLDYGSYRTELYGTSSLQLGVARGAEDAFDLPASSPDAGARIAAYYYWLFPNLMFNFYPWGLSVNVVRPVAVDMTKVSFLTYVLDASRLDRGAGAGLDRVEREDETVVEAVQRGVRARLYERGRYSPTREQGVHHFHRLLAGALAPDTRHG